MTTRPDPFVSRFDLVKPLIDFGTFAKSGLDPILAELICFRASQINGCAACLTYHLAEARKHGETEERIIMLNAWRESSLFSHRERVALAWTEALTRVEQSGAPNGVYDDLKANFSEEEQIKITLLVGAINAFNRMNIGFHRHALPAAGQKAA